MLLLFFLVVPSKVSISDMEFLITYLVQERVIYKSTPWHTLKLLENTSPFFFFFLDVLGIGTENLIWVVIQWILVLLLYGKVSDTSE